MRTAIECWCQRDSYLQDLCASDPSIFVQQLLQSPEVLVLGHNSTNAVCLASFDWYTSATIVSNKLHNRWLELLCSSNIFDFT